MTRPPFSRELDRTPPGSRVAILRLRSLGDCVLATPAIHLLKRHRPDLEIGVCVEDRFSDVFRGNPDIDVVLPPSAGAIAGFRPRLTINLHGGPRSIGLTIASMAPRRAGFAHYRAAALYNVRIPTAQEILGENRIVHTAEHAASAMFFLGVPQREIPRARLFAGPNSHSKPYAVIHPFASAAGKAWPPDRFVTIARNLGIPAVVIGAASDDFSPFLEFDVSCGTLAETSSIIAGASVFVGNDSGPAHMAAAHGIPLVVLFGPSDETIWAPWRAEARVLKNRDIAQIRVAEVEEALTSLGALR